MPSSTRIIAAAATIGLVTEAMRKIVSRRIGSPLSNAVVPMTSTWISPRRLSQVTRPGSVLALDMAGHDLVHALEPRLGQSSAVHGLFPPSCLIRS